MDPHDDDESEEVALTPGEFLLLAVAFEAALALLAVGGSWLVGQEPLAGMTFQHHPSSRILADAGWGLAAAAPLCLGLLVLRRIKSGPFGRLNRLVTERLAPLFREFDLAGLALLSIAAGVGEEMLFRGFVQGWLASVLPLPWGLFVGLAAGSLLFGVCHWLSNTYFALATCLGIYLGLLYWWTGSLVAPIVAHAAYDLFALVFAMNFSAAPDGDEAA